MSKVLIKTMISELGTIIPQDELDKIADKITEVIDLKSKATRSNIDPLAKSERVKSAILQLGNIKEEIIEKLYDHGVEEPEKIRALTMKTMKKIDKAMESKFVVKCNLRMLIEMSHQRMCNRAFWEYRQLMRDLCQALKARDEEWEYIINTYMKPKCDILGYCPEKFSCGRRPKKEDKS